MSGILRYPITLKQLYTKSFITKALEYKAVLKFKKQFVCVAMHFLGMSP